MASSLRTVSRFLRTKEAFTQVSRRCLHAKRAGTGYGAVRPILLGAAAVGGAYGAYKAYQGKHLAEAVADRLNFNVSAAGPPASQDSVFSQGKNHALYLWIHLKPSADAKACAKAVAKIQGHVDAVCPPSLRDEDDEIWAGVGFGPDFYSQVAGKAKQNFNYPHRRGQLGHLPSSGGDIFVHAKSNDYSKLFELCQRVVAALPAGSVANFEDIYSFVYQNGRDLSGFIDGTENAADDDDRKDIAVEKETGGSYVITQKWVHKMDVIAREKESTVEQWLGRSRPDSTELRKKTATSHVARMTEGNTFAAKKPFQIVRQSMPYGNLNDKAGLFFIGYAASPENFEYMLERMVGAGGDGHCDDVMRLTECIKGTYWYFPGKQELKRLA